MGNEADHQRATRSSGKLSTGKTNILRDYGNEQLTRMVRKNVMLDHMSGDKGRTVSYAVFGRSEPTFGCASAPASNALNRGVNIEKGENELC